MNGASELASRVRQTEKVQGGSGRLQKQLEREREREREIKRGQGKRKEESNVPEWSGNVEVFRPFLCDTR